MTMTPLKNLIKDRKTPKPKPGNFAGLPIREPGKQTRFRIDNEFLAKGYTEVFRGKRVLDVYCVLAKYANAQNQSCFPSISTIMREGGIKNRNTVVDAIKLLEAFGLIYVERSKGWRPNQYVLLRVSSWKSPNSIALDTVLQKKTMGRTVSNNTGEQYQKQPENSITSDTRNHITKSEKEVTGENKKTEERNPPLRGSQLFERLLPATKSVVTPYFSKADIMSALEEFDTNTFDVRKLGYKSLLEVLRRRGAKPLKELPDWMKSPNLL